MPLTDMQANSRRSVSRYDLRFLREGASRRVALKLGLSRRCVHFTGKGDRDYATATERIRTAAAIAGIRTAAGVRATARVRSGSRSSRRDENERDRDGRFLANSGGLPDVRRYLDPGVDLLDPRHEDGTEGLGRRGALSRNPRDALVSWLGRILDYRPSWNGGQRCGGRRSRRTVALNVSSGRASLPSSRDRSRCATFLQVDLERVNGLREHWAELHAGVCQPGKRLSLESYPRFRFASLEADTS